MLHEEAFVNQAELLLALRQKATFPLQIVEISSAQLSVTDAVASYLFNSQLITLPTSSAQKTMALIAPIECAQNASIDRLIQSIISDHSNPISVVHYLDLKQSMRNGGGPACLRLRVPLTEHELSAMHPRMLVTDALLDTLELWVKKHYRSELRIEDLSDPQLMKESFAALDELTKLLQLGNLYPFQHEKTQ